VTTDKTTITIEPTAPETAAKKRGPGSVSASIEKKKSNTSLPSGIPDAGNSPTIGARNVAKKPNTSHRAVGVSTRRPAFSPTTRAIDPVASSGIVAIAPKKKNSR
jgi:hypothetical protein